MKINLHVEIIQSMKQAKLVFNKKDLVKKKIIFNFNIGTLNIKIIISNTNLLIFLICGRISAKKRRCYEKGIYRRKNRII